MSPAELLPIMVRQTRDFLKPMSVDVHLHAGKFVWTELMKISYRAPAVFVSCLGWREASDTEAAQLASYGGSIQRVRFIAGIVTKSNKSANARNEQARLIGELLTGFISDWDSDVLEASGFRCEPLFVPAAEDDNQSLWLLDWWHVMSFDAADVKASLAAFLVAHGDHFASPGAHTDAGGNDLIASQDIVDLPQE